MEPKVIFEDEQILVLEKPAGWIVNKADTTKGETVQDWLEKRFHVSSSELGVGGRAGIVHRLDKETSGLLLVAKTQEAFEELQRQFKERVVEKKYLALVAGKVTPTSGEIDAPVGRLPWNRERFGVFPGGKEAKTEYQTINNLTINNQQYTYLELTPHTGRTHQIRVHLKHLGYPIVGDEFYGGRKKAREERLWCPRVFLHAAYLRFRHPQTEQMAEFKSDLPADLKKMIYG